MRDLHEELQAIDEGCEKTAALCVYVTDPARADVVAELVFQRAVPYAKSLCRGGDEGFDAVVKGRLAELLKGHARAHLPFDFFPGEPLAEALEKVDWDAVAVEAERAILGLGPAAPPDVALN